MKNPSKKSINPRAGFLKRSTNRPLARLIKNKRDNNQIDAVKMIKGKSPQISQKFKPSSENITNNSTHIN